MGNEQSGAAGAGAGAGAGASAVSSPLPSNSNVSSPPPQQGTVLPKGVKRMPPDLQKKFATAGSVQNMRILIRGASGTGKSALFARLEGGPFLDNHVPTPEVQVTHIAWNYKMTDDVVKVEVWDVVDHAPEVNASVISPGRRASVDAASIDIYRGAHAVILMCDPCRRETLEYCEELLPTIPKNMAVLLLVNFRDLYKKHVLKRADIERFLARQPARLRCLECSMRDCYGLKELYSFINVPFAQLRLAALQAQIARAEADIEQALHETELITRHQDYDRFILAQQAMRAASGLAPVAEPAEVTRSPSLTAQPSPDTLELDSKSSHKSKDSKHRSSTSSSSTRHKSKEKHDEDVDLHDFKPGDDVDPFFSDEEDSGKKPVAKAAEAKQPSKPIVATPHIDETHRNKRMAARGLLVDELPEFDENEVVPVPPKPVPAKAVVAPVTKAPSKPAVRPGMIADEEPSFSDDEKPAVKSSKSKSSDKVSSQSKAVSQPVAQKSVEVKKPTARPGMLADEEPSFSDDNTAVKSSKVVSSQADKKPTSAPQSQTEVKTLPVEAVPAVAKPSPAPVMLADEEPSFSDNEVVAAVAPALIAQPASVVQPPTISKKEPSPTKVESKPATAAVASVSVKQSVTKPVVTRAGMLADEEPEFSDDDSVPVAKPPAAVAEKTKGVLMPVPDDFPSDSDELDAPPAKPVVAAVAQKSVSLESDDEDDVFGAVDEPDFGEFEEDALAAQADLKQKLKAPSATSKAAITVSIAPNLAQQAPPTVSSFQAVEIPESADHGSASRHESKSERSKEHKSKDRDSGREKERSRDKDKREKSSSKHRSGDA